MVDFKFKPFNEMTDKDYKKIGFKSGLEVHQQLLTEKKLFCRCPAGKYSHEYHAEILRHMRPTLSEMGEYDGTALMEYKTKKNIIYRIHHDSVCTYEMDDTPPFEINEDALDISLQIGMLLDATLADELHIMRKQYLDGSIPTGFQRTAIICVNGAIPYKGRKINIIQTSIEEDSCREESDLGHERVYLTDRLGTPLIETVTAPDMKTPVEVAEVNNVLRRLARSTGKVRTGIGAGRQDVNVSVRGGTRIEIKGVSRIPYIPLLVYNEAMRQWNLLRLREELKKRGVTEATFEADFQDVTRLLRKTIYKPIRDAIAEGKIVNCVALKGFKDLLTWRTQTDVYFSKEISDRVRVVACLTTLPNIIHSDSPGESISSSDWRKIKKTTSAGDNDVLALVWGDHIDAETGAKEIMIRAREATIGVPSETRQALLDGTNGFERILPGPQRMYPDTDLPPKKISDERKERLRVGLPKQFWDNEKWYRKLGIPIDVVSVLSISKFAGLFERLVKEYKIDPRFASIALIQFPKRLKKKGLDIGLLTVETMESVMLAYKNKEVFREGVLPMMESCIRNGGYSRALAPKPCSKKKLKNVIEKAKKKMKKMTIHNPEKTEHIMMGLAMNKLRGRISAKEVMKKFKHNLNGKWA